MSGGDPTTGPLTSEELQLATRNHGMPLEALRYEITPTGLHYLLVHFDIPRVDPETWRLEIGGNVDAPRSLSYADLTALPAATLPVTMECAGNGRARLTPRPVSQPWLVEAVGTAVWKGVPLRDVIAAAGVRPGTAELVFSGADTGVQGGETQAYERSLPPAEALRPEVLLAYEMNGRPLEPQHGAPVRLVVPGWYGMTSVKWLLRITAVTEPFRGYQQREAYRYQQDADDPGQPVDRIRVRALMAPPGHPDFMSRARFVASGRGRALGPRLERVRRRRACRGRGGRRLGGRRSSTHPSATSPGAAGATSGGRSPASTWSRAGPPTPPATSSRSSSPGTTRAWATTWCRPCRSASASADARERSLRVLPCPDRSLASRRSQNAEEARRPLGRRASSQAVRTLRRAAWAWPG